MSDLYDGLEERDGCLGCAACNFYNMKGNLAQFQTKTQSVKLSNLERHAEQQAHKHHVVRWRKRHLGEDHDGGGNDKVALRTAPTEHEFNVVWDACLKGCSSKPTGSTTDDSKKRGLSYGALQKLNAAGIGAC